MRLYNLHPPPPLCPDPAQGASGVALRGIMGTVPVATKLIEVPQLDEQDAKAGSSASDAAAAAGPDRAAAHADAKAKKDKDNLCARHTMYRNAMELAVLRSTTHVNIVQVGSPPSEEHCTGARARIAVGHRGRCDTVRVAASCRRRSRSDAGQPCARQP